MVAHKEASLIPKLQEQFAEFLQHHSLNRLSILYSSTSVGFGYGLLRGCYFQEPLRCPQNPLTSDNLQNSSHPTGSGLLT